MSNVLRKAFGTIGSTVINKAFTGSASSQAVIGSTTYRLLATEDCHITLDGTTATTNSMRIVANIPEVISTTDEQTSLSVISAGTNGTLQLVVKESNRTTY